MARGGASGVDADALRDGAADSPDRAESSLGGRKAPMADITHDPAGPRREHHEVVTVLGALLRRTSWGAVIAGAVASISVQMILTVLGIAVGITTNDVVLGRERIPQGLQVGAAVWWLATGTASLFIGGCVVGRFTGMTRSPDVPLHGFTMWAVTALFGFLVVTAGAGALYGTSMDATYVGSRAVYEGQAEGEIVVRTGVGATDSNSDGHRVVVTQDEAQRFVRSASWWTLLGLTLGIAASLSGCWLTAPDRIVLRPASERVV